MTRRAKQPDYQRVAIHHEHIVDEISRSDFTIDATATVDPAGQIVGIAIHPRIGPGVGPHVTPNPDWCSNVGWAFINTGHAVRRALHLGPPEHPTTGIPGQLTFEDA